MTYNITIKTSDQSLTLNRVASKYPFEIWVHGKSGQADAKSMLGLMLLTLETELTLTVPDGADTAAFIEEIKDFITPDE